jgi:Tol biopolymer transport system component
MGNSTVSSALAAALLAAACASPEPEAGPSIASIPGADTGFYQELSWSPDGRQLLVSVLEKAADTTGFAYHIVVVPADSGAVVPLTKGPRDYWTSWSPDGNRLVFNGRGASSSDIIVVNRDGSGRTVLTASASEDIQPDWSPDGSRIVFVSTRSGREQVWTMRHDGGDARILFESPGRAQNPRWSPDGRHVTWFEMHGGGNDSLMVGNADGSARRTIGPGIWPSWAPGDSLVFTAGDGLALASVQSGGSRPLVRGEIVNGEFSPDGSRLAFIEKARGEIMVVVAGADGSERRVLMRRPAPVW